MSVRTGAKTVDFSGLEDGVIIEIYTITVKALYSDETHASARIEAGGTSATLTTLLTTLQKAAAALGLELTIDANDKIVIAGHTINTNH